MKEKSLPQAFDTVTYGDAGTGKQWPHGARGGDQPRLPLKFTAPLSPQMRLMLADLRDKAFIDGEAHGRRETEREYYGNGLISLSIGGFVGAGLFWLIQRVFA